MSTLSGEGVELRRELVGLDRDAYLSDLARSLWNVGWVTRLLHDHDHVPTAIEATTEAVRIYTELAATEPDAFMPLRDAAAENLTQITAEQ